MEQLIDRYLRALSATPTNIVRYLDSKINWNSSLIAILGARGVGKTTLMRQHIKLNNEVATSLYVDAGDIYFADHTLYGLAEEFYKQGGKKLYIDETHKYSNWSTEIKMMEDFMPDFQVVYSGSPILSHEKGGADLSRRKLQYYLPGLSFREYLKFKHDIDVRVFSLEELLHSTVAPLESAQRPIALFKEYLNDGYYPFPVKGDFYDRLLAALNTALDIDIAQFANLTVPTIKKLRKLFYMIAQTVPSKPNVSKLAKAIGCGWQDTADLIELLNAANLTRSVEIHAKGLAKVKASEKLLLNDANLAYAVSKEAPNIGTLRETAFCQMVSPVLDVEASGKADYKIGEYQFEVGGKNKGTQQVAGIKNAYIVRDDSEYRSFNFIPLWYFGFLY